MYLGQGRCSISDSPIAVDEYAIKNIWDAVLFFVSGNGLNSKSVVWKAIRPIVVSPHKRHFLSVRRWIVFYDSRRGHLDITTLKVQVTKWRELLQQNASTLKLNPSAVYFPCLITICSLWRLAILSLKLKGLSDQLKEIKSNSVGIRRYHPFSAGIWKQ